MNPVSLTLAKSLAVAYSALTLALEKNDNLGVRVWSRILKKAQNETGIELLMTNDTLSKLENIHDLGNSRISAKAGGNAVAA